MSDNRTERASYVNIGIIIANILYFIFLESIGTTEDADLMIRYGAVYGPLVVEGKQYYRLLASVFMHFGIGHIVNNMIVLFVLGNILERVLGHLKYIIFYLLCGVGANVVSLFFSMGSYAETVSAGASGAIFGVVGGLLYAVIINKGWLEGLSTKQLLFMIVLSMYHGITSKGVDNVAHVSGLIFGIFLGILLYRRPKCHRDLYGPDMWR